MSINLKYWQAIDDAIAILQMEAIPVEWLKEYEDIRNNVPVEGCDDAQNNVPPITQAINAYMNI